MSSFSDQQDKRGKKNEHLFLPFFMTE
uniref:Uncharacterized protein n=1 Tax=Nelumbo nucifera TaxID=4432 RepID=A0A822ZXB9_NELNU|nr:TPA_asm: hypothetical protein HUJ06_016485 [Nelumbo nucifera]